MDKCGCQKRSQDMDQLKNVEKKGLERISLLTLTV